MPLPKSPSAYTHVKQILDAALGHNKTIYILATPDQAIRWRQEAYYFRRLQQKAGITRYDNFLLKLDGPKVILEKRHVAGALTTEDGTRIEPAAATDISIDGDLSEAESFALNFAKKLGLETNDDEE